MGNRSVTPASSLCLARFTSTYPESWLNLQQVVDLWDALHSDRGSELTEAAFRRPQPATGLL